MARHGNSAYGEDSMSMSTDVTASPSVSWSTSTQQYYDYDDDDDRSDSFSADNKENESRGPYSSSLSQGSSRALPDVESAVDRRGDRRTSRNTDQLWARLSVHAASAVMESDEGRSMIRPNQIAKVATAAANSLLEDGQEMEKINAARRRKNRRAIKISHQTLRNAASKASIAVLQSSIGSGLDSQALAALVASTILQEGGKLLNEAIDGDGSVSTASTHNLSLGRTSTRKTKGVSKPFRERKHIGSNQTQYRSPMLRDDETIQTVDTAKFGGGDKYALDNYSVASIPSQTRSCFSSGKPSTRSETYDNATVDPIPETASDWQQPSEMTTNIGNPSYLLSSEGISSNESRHCAGEPMQHLPDTRVEHQYDDSSTIRTEHYHDLRGFHSSSHEPAQESLRDFTTKSNTEDIKKREADFIAAAEFLQSKLDELGNPSSLEPSRESLRDLTTKPNAEDIKDREADFIAAAQFLQSKLDELEEGEGEAKTPQVPDKLSPLTTINSAGRHSAVISKNGEEVQSILRPPSEYFPREDESQEWVFDEDGTCHMSIGDLKVRAEGRLNDTDDCTVPKFEMDAQHADHKLSLQSEQDESREEAIEVELVESDSKASKRDWFKMFRRKKVTFANFVEEQYLDESTAAHQLDHARAEETSGTARNKKTRRRGLRKLFNRRLPSLPGPKIFRSESPREKQVTVESILTPESDEVPESNEVGSPCCGVDNLAPSHSSEGPAKMIVNQNATNQLAPSLAQQLMPDMNEQHSSGWMSHDDGRFNVGVFTEKSFQPRPEEPPEIQERSSNGQLSTEIHERTDNGQPKTTALSSDSMTTANQTATEESTFSSHENLQIDQTLSAETKSTSTGGSKPGTWAGMMSIFAPASSSMSMSTNASESTMSLSKRSETPSLNVYTFM